MEKTLQERNEAIARFMGETSLTKVKNDKIVPYNKSYETIWENIMPVCDKIEKLGNYVTIEKNVCGISCDYPEEEEQSGLMFVIDPITAETKIEAVFLAVSDFCIQYQLGEDKQ